MFEFCVWYKIGVFVVVSSFSEINIVITVLRTGEFYFRYVFVNDVLSGS